MNPPFQPMKTRSWILLSVTFLAMPVAAQLAVPTVATPTTNRATQTITNMMVENWSRTAVSRWQVRSRSEHQTEWFSVRYTTNAVTGRVRAATNSYIELATGLNRPGANGGWERASSAFQITATGAEANLAGHRVRLAGNINSAGSVRVEKDGVIMQGHPLCVAYYDPVDGRSLLLAELVDSVGSLVSSNEVVYSNCFNGLRASIHYRNSCAGLEQDLVLHERPALTPQELGFSDKTRLELFTEWIGETPLPEKHARPLQRTMDPELRQQMVEPDFSDFTLTFGGLQMSMGKAFNAGERSPGNEVQVGKRFEVIAGRKILIEAVEHRSIRTMLDRLPAAPRAGALTNAAVRPQSNLSGAQLAAISSKPPAVSAKTGVAKVGQPIRLLPAKRLAQTKTDSRIQTAANFNAEFGTRNADLAAVQPPTFVLDWQLLSTGSSLTDYTFYGTNTYHVTGHVSLSGTTVFEGGMVVKYNPASSAPSLRIHGPVQCETSDLLPAIFTAMDDNTVGETLPGSTGNPGGYSYGNESLFFDGPSVDLKHLRVNYSAGSALAFYNTDAQNRVRHCQFLLSWGIWAQFNSLTLHNVLMEGGWALVEGGNFNVHAEHVTARNIGSIADGPWSSITLVNSILLTLTDITVPPTLDHTEWFLTDEPIFQSVGAGNYYLADDTYRNSGTSNIDPTLRAELAKRTTHPPQVLTGTAAPNLVLSPRPLGDADALDLGYHYPIVDYAVNLYLYNSTVLITNGVVLATFGQYGFWLNGSELVSEGTPDRLNRFLSYTVVQEQSVNWGGNSLQGSATLQTYTFQDPGLVAPKIQMRFTALESARNWDYHLYSIGGPWTASRIELRDCQFRAGAAVMAGDSANPSKIGLTNNVFQAVNTLEFSGSADLHAFNNLFHYCTIGLSRSIPSDWQLRDNAFDHCYMWDYDAPSQHDHNAYISCLVETSNGMEVQLQPPNSSDKLLTSFTYADGPFGLFYQAAGSPLINQGSRTAANAGLYHYTTSTTTGSKDGTDPPSPYQVDIGVHYVGASSLNQPIDTDGDGLPDYFEDRNGNGTFDQGDIASFNIPDTNANGVLDGWEYQSGLIFARRNYLYDRLNRLQNVTGIGQVQLTLEKEGNITDVRP